MRWVQLLALPFYLCWIYRTSGLIPSLYGSIDPRGPGGWPQGPGGVVAHDRRLGSDAPEARMDALLVPAPLAGANVHTAHSYRRGFFAHVKELVQR
jgi:hypothetical protein